MIGKPSGRRKVLCLGRTYCDIIFTGLHDMPMLGRERFAEDVAIAAGGGAYITAAHLSSLSAGQRLSSRALEPILCRTVSIPSSKPAGSTFPS